MIRFALLAVATAAQTNATTTTELSCTTSPVADFCACTEDTDCVEDSVCSTAYAICIDKDTVQELAADLPSITARPELTTVPELTTEYNPADDLDGSLDDGTGYNPGYDSSYNPSYDSDY